MNEKVIKSTFMKTVRLLLSIVSKPLIMLALIMIMAPSTRSFAAAKPPIALTVSPNAYTAVAGTEKTITVTVNDNKFYGLQALTISGYGTTSMGAGTVTYPIDRKGNTATAVLKDDTTTVQAYYDKPGDGQNSSTTIAIRLNKAMNEAFINYSVVDDIKISNKVKTTISPAAPNRLAVIQDIESPPINGGIFASQPKVAVLDMRGNICPGGTNVITVSKNDSGPWELIGTLTVTAEKGVAAFSNLRAANDPFVKDAQLKFTSPGLTPVFSSSVTLPAKVFTVTFKDSDGKTLKAETVTYGSAAKAPVVPGKLEYSFSWDTPFDHITSNTTVVAQYSKKIYTLKVSGGTGEGDYEASSKVSVTATVPKDKVFAYWQDETGSIVSYNRTYNFIITSDKTLTATFDDKQVAEVPIISLDNSVIKLNVNDSYGKMYFTSTVTVPKGYTLVDCVVVVSKDISTV